MEFDKLKHSLEKNKVKMMDIDKYRIYSVFIPIVKTSEGYSILFEVRAKHLKRQPGDICFPGGRLDEGDLTSQHTAVRETCEELGVGLDQIQVLGELDYMVTPFKTIIYSFVGIVKNPDLLKPNPEEVDEIFTVPIEFLTNQDPKKFQVNMEMKPEDSFPLHLINRGEKYDWSKHTIDEYFYFYENRVIWGLTAKILHHFLNEHLI